MKSCPLGRLTNTIHLGRLNFSSRANKERSAEGGPCHQAVAPLEYFLRVGIKQSSNGERKWGQFSVYPNPKQRMECAVSVRLSVQGGTVEIYKCSSWIFCTIYVCIPNVSLVVETASPLHACTVTVPCAHLLFSPLKSFSTSIVSPFHTL